MVNESKEYKNIEVEKLNKLLHEKAANPPQCDPFTVEGNITWVEYAAGCRETERQLESLGGQSMTFPFYDEDVRTRDREIREMNRDRKEELREYRREHQ